MKDPDAGQDNESGSTLNASNLAKIKPPHRHMRPRSRVSIKTKEKKILKDQDKDLSFKERLAKWLIALSFVGYFIMSLFLGLSGSNEIDFYLPPEVLITLIVSTMGSSIVYALRHAFTSIFSGS